MKTMRRIRHQMLSRLRQFRWKLTLSYTAVTVAALLVAEIVLFLGLAPLFGVALHGTFINLLKSDFNISANRQRHCLILIELSTININVNR